MSISLPKPGAQTVGMRPSSAEHSGFHSSLLAAAELLGAAVVVSPACRRKAHAEEVFTHVKRKIGRILLRAAAARRIASESRYAKSEAEQLLLRAVFASRGADHADASRDYLWIGACHEALLSLTPRLDRNGRLRLETKPGHRRKRTGAYFTPPRLVDHLLDVALEPALDEAEASAGARGLLAVRICDPACGTGNFLIPAARRVADRLRRHGGRHSRLAMDEVVRRCIFGLDVNPQAVDLCRGLLSVECIDAGAAPSGHLRQGDALTEDWPATAFRVVLGNPPFLSQLRTTTAHARRRASALKRRLGSVVRPYTDPAAMFLLTAVRRTQPGGRAAMVQPQSVLASRDCAGIREELSKAASLESLWVAGAKIFDAGVLVCGPSFRVGVNQGTVRRWAGTDFRPLAEMAPGGLGPESWSRLAAAGIGIPELNLSSTRQLGEMASATADFRDQYYGLRGLVIEDNEVLPRHRSRHPKLVTTGLIDLGTCRWGQVPTRFDRRVWRAPRVDLRRLGAETDLGPWARARLVPKVLLATQTRVLEAVVDPEGSWLPAVPLITVVPMRLDRLWHVAAVLCSPVATAWAATHYGGVGLSPEALKLSAGQVLRLPIPQDGGTWDRAAAELRAAAEREEALRFAGLERMGDAMCRAYDLADGVRTGLMSWWLGRMRVRRT